MPMSRYLFGTLPWYSVLIVTGVCLAIFLASREEKRLGLPKDTVVDLALWIIPAGIAGARLYYVAFAWDTFRRNPVSVLHIWQGGLAIYGAVIGGLLAAMLFSRKRRLPLTRLTDMIVPGLLLAQAVGRWGNFFNMEAYGLPVTDPAWQFFPAAVRIPAPGGDAWHMATFFYESLWNALGFTALWLTRKRMRRAGDTTLWYFLLYGAGRMIIEGLRTDSLMATSTLRISQLLSAVLCLAAVTIFASRALRRISRRSLIMGLASGLTIAVCAELLPHPAAFTGYEPVCLIVLTLLQTTGAALLIGVRDRRVLLCGLGVIVCVVTRIVLAGASLAPWAISALAACALSAALITGGAGAYTAANAQARSRSSTAT